MESQRRLRTWWSHEPTMVSQALRIFFEIKSFCLHEKWISQSRRVWITYRRLCLLKIHTDQKRERDLFQVELNVPQYRNLKFEFFYRSNFPWLMCVLTTYNTHPPPPPHAHRFFPLQPPSVTDTPSVSVCPFHVLFDSSFSLKGVFILGQHSLVVVRYYSLLTWSFSHGTCVYVCEGMCDRERERVIERGSSWPAVTHDHSINIRGRKSQRSGKRDTVCVCLCLDRFACVNTTLTVSGKTGDLRRYFVKYSIMIDETERR